MVCSSIREGLNRAGGLASPGGDKAAPVTYKKIPDIMRPVIFVYHRGLRIVAHAACSQKMETERLLLDRIRPALLCAGRFQQLHSSILKKSHVLQIIRVVL